MAELQDNYTDGALYIRVSTDKQEELSPDAQKRLLLDYAKKHKILIKDEHIFIENGISGRVSHSLCNLYDLTDSNGHESVKLLIGSLHWMRKIRNSCAHNERVYCLTRKQDRRNNSGRILERYLRTLGRSYTRDLEQKIFDLIVYFKYYLPKTEYKHFISEIKAMLLDLQSKIHPHAFQYVRGQMGIKSLQDLDTLVSLPKDEIEYNKFDK